METINKINPLKENLLLFLGAGFSHSAGLPLTKDLFKKIPFCPTSSLAIVSRYKRVLLEWKKWKRNSRGPNPEIWLKELYLKNNRNNKITFDDAVEFLSARIVSLPTKYGKNGAYYYGISTSITSKAHWDFWKNLFQKFNINTIITTNFDIAIEQGLRNSYSTSSNNRKAPFCKYGGFPATFEQKIRIMTNVAPQKFREDILDGDIELFKLHGSVNWVEGAQTFNIHDDVRAVYWVNRQKGKPRIIPPLKEKNRPPWAYDIWKYAAVRLKENDVWFVCGYSLPVYDIAIRKLIKDVTKGKNYLTLYISDPNSTDIKARWKRILKCKHEIVTLPGIPRVNSKILII